MRRPLIEISNVVLPNPDRLNDVTLSVFENVSAVLGASGAGKTSLLNVIVGFETPESGSISAIEHFWVPQDGGLWPQLTVQEHLDIMKPETPSQLLEDFSLNKIAHAYPDQLSRGEQSRLSVARALLSKAPLLVMDEPLSHLDPALINDYWSVLISALEKHNKALLFATHDPAQVLRHADHVIGIDNGRISFQGKTEDLYHRPPTRETANLLGKTNWITPDEATILFKKTIKNAQSFRPEEIVIEPAASSDLSIQSEAFEGACSEFSLQSESTDETLSVRCRPAVHRLPHGTPVVLRILTLLLAFLFVACSNESTQLPLGNVRTWKVPPFGSTLPAARSVAVGPEDEVVVLDNAGRVLVYDSDGNLNREWTMPEYDVGRPEGVVVLKDGRVIVCDTHYHRIVCFSSQGEVLNTFGSNGTEHGQFIYPVAITTDPEENLFICEYGSNDRVQKFRPDGTFLLAFGAFGTAPGEFQRPSGIVWHEKTVYVADAINNRVQAFTDGGEFLHILTDKGAPISLHFPYDMVMAADQTLYLVEYGAGRITRLAIDGSLLGRYGSNGSKLNQLSTPWGITIDSEDRIRIADTGNRRIVALELMKQ